MEDLSAVKEQVEVLIDSNLGKMRQTQKLMPTFQYRPVSQAL